METETGGSGTERLGRAWFLECSGTQGLNSSEAPGGGRERTNISGTQGCSLGSNLSNPGRTWSLKSFPRDVRTRGLGNSVLELRVLVLPLPPGSSNPGFGVFCEEIKERKDKEKACPSWEVLLLKGGEKGLEVSVENSKAAKKCT